MEQNRLALVVKIKAEKKLAGDEEVGEAHVPIKELLESYSEESKDERCASYSVRTQKAEGPKPSEKNKKTPETQKDEM